MSRPISTPLDRPLTGTEASSGRDLLAGALAGQIAGLVMAVVVMAVFTLFLGKGPLYPVQVIGSFLLGDRALDGFQPLALFAGLVLHQFGPSLFWGVVFGLLVSHVRSGSSLIVLAVAVGLASQVIDVMLVLPVAMTWLHGHDIWAENVPTFWSWAAHLVFALGLLSYGWVKARLDGRAAR